MYYMSVTCQFLVSDKIFPARLGIIRIFICIVKNECLKTVVKTGLQLKIRQSKSFIIMHRNILITNIENCSVLLSVPSLPLQQLEKQLSAVTFPLFHFKVAQCGIYSKTMTFITLLQKNCIYSSLSRENLSFK